MNGAASEAFARRREYEPACSGVVLYRDNVVNGVNPHVRIVPYEERLTSENALEIFRDFDYPGLILSLLRPRKRSIENLIRRESPAHTAGNIEYVEARMRIGFQSMIGLDAVVARVPQDVVLGKTRLDKTKVLTGNAATKVGTGRLGPGMTMN